MNSADHGPDQESACTKILPRERISATLMMTALASGPTMRQMLVLTERQRRRAFRSSVGSFFRQARIAGQVARGTAIIKPFDEP